MAASGVVYHGGTETPRRVGFSELFRSITLESPAMPDNQLFYGDNLDVLRRYIGRVGRPRLPRSALQQPPGLQRPLRRKGRHPLRRADQGLRGHLGVEPRRRARLRGSRRARRPRVGRHARLPHLPRQQRHDGLPRHDGAALIELQRVLKATGSIYLHCDPTASHYLKMLMDGGARP